MIRKNTFLIPVLLLVLAAACKKDNYGRTATFLRNTLTRTRIIITPYLRDSAQTALVRIIEPRDSLLIYSDLLNGKSIGSPWSSVAEAYDSVRVSFADTSRLHPDTARIAHVRRDLNVSYPHFIPATSPRSLYNPDAYTSEVLEETSFMLRGRYVYTFTTQDSAAAR